MLDWDSDWILLDWDSDWIVLDWDSSQNSPADCVPVECLHLTNIFAHLNQPDSNHSNKLARLDFVDQKGYFYYKLNLELFWLFGKYLFRTGTAPQIQG